jgi:hypothetical protein
MALAISFRAALEALPGAAAGDCRVSRSTTARATESGESSANRRANSALIFAFDSLRD